MVDYDTNTCQNTSVYGQHTVTVERGGSGVELWTMA